MAGQSSALNVAELPKVKEELEKDPAFTEEADADLRKKAADWVERLIQLNPEDLKQKEDGKQAVEGMGLDLQKESARLCSLLNQPIRKLSERADDKGDVGNALVSLKMQVEKLDPAKVDFEPGWFSRLLGRIPGVGEPLKRYFSKYESAQTVITAILKSLEKGRDELQRDIITLTEEQKRMRDATRKLSRMIQLAQLLDKGLENKLATQIPAGNPRHDFIAEELLFPLRQRIMDLQQQLAVNQQGVLASEIIIRNNRELVRGVNRSLNVTSTALSVGATVAIALGTQKKVIEKLDAVSQTTSDLIAGTAQRLKTQGTEIHRQASSATLNIQSLKSAFTDLNAALSDIAQFRRNALPQMASTILELEEVTSDAEKAIKKLESSRTAQAKNSLVIQADEK
jgi:uncharacterized protein YaaN involved in tellurite resistance